MKRRYYIVLPMLLPLIAWAVWIGVYPKPYFDVLEKPVAQIVARVRPGYFQKTPAGRSVTVAARQEGAR